MILVDTTVLECKMVVFGTILFLTRICYFSAFPADFWTLLSNTVDLNS